MDPIDLTLLAVQLAKIYKLFDETTKELSAEEKAELWAKTQKRARQARDIWETP
jgi:hypothetical protein